MKIIKSELPSTSILHTTKYDYIDSYSGFINDPHCKCKIEEVCKTFFTSAPTWVESLFAIRNKLVKIVGLKVPETESNREEALRKFKCEEGGKMGLFKIYTVKDNEIILGEDDKHLDFRISMILQGYDSTNLNRKITLSTTVLFHNKFGKAYFIPVRFFHKLIVPSMLNSICRNLENQLHEV